MKSRLTSRPWPRLLFRPRLRPLHLPVAMMTSRRNSMFAKRRSSLKSPVLVFSRFSGYAAATQAIMAGPVLPAQKIGPGSFDVGLGTGVLNETPSEIDPWTPLNIAYACQAYVLFNFNMFSGTLWIV